MQKLFYTVLLAAFVASPALAQKKPAKPDVSAALQAWVDAVEERDIEKTVALYDKDAVFFSTFATTPLKTQDERREYYKKVLASEEIAVEIIEDNPRIYGGDVAINSGLYDLSYTEEGEDVVIHSRFTFTYVLRGGKWVIVDHHSSKMPGTKAE